MILIKSTPLLLINTTNIAIAKIRNMVELNIEIFHNLVGE